MSGKIELDLEKNFVDIPGGLMDIGILGTSFFTILISISFCLLSIFLIFKMSQLRIIEFKRSLLIFTFHSIISMFFISLLVSVVVNDLDSYFQTGLFFPDEGHEEIFNFKHWGILTLAFFYRIFHLYFQLDFLSINILFACIGSFILIFFDKLIRENVSINKSKNILNYLFYFLVFFPSFSIWTSALGKEVLTILLLLTLAYIMIKEKKIIKKLIIFFPIILLLTLIRPHFAFFMIASLFVYLVFVFVNNNFLRIFLLLTTFFLFLILGSTFILKEFTFDVISIIGKFFEVGLDQRNNLLKVQLQTFDPGEISTNVFKLYFYFLFSPIFDFGSVRDLFLSTENLALIVLMTILIFNIDIKKIKSNHEAKFFLIFFIISSFVLCNFTYQSGLYWRMKWLVIPYFFIGISLIQKDNLINNAK